MADISKDTFAPAKGYRKVVFQQQRPAMDFDFNESVDLGIYEREQLARQLADGVNLLGSAGAMVPAASATARKVDISKGIGVHDEKIIAIPAQTDFSVFDVAVTTGTQTSTVYVEYRDVEVLYTDDADIYDPAFGESGARVKREVVVKVSYTSAMPALTVGWDGQFLLGKVTHDFDADGLIIKQGDISQTAAPTPGELIGLGPSRTLRIVSAAPSTATAFDFDTSGPVAGTTTVAMFRRQGELRGSINGYGQYRSYAAQGIAPFVVESTTKVVDLNADLLDGLDSAFYLDATNINAGTLADDWLSANVPLLDAQNTFGNYQMVLAGLEGDPAWASKVSGEGYTRFLIVANGEISWGDGTTGRDTNLYRSAANVLRTDDSFEVGVGLSIGGGVPILDSDNIPLLDDLNVFTTVQTVLRPTAGNQAFRSWADGDVFHRFIRTADGHMSWGSGAASPDTNLYRSAANTLKTDDALHVGGNELRLTSAAALLTVATGSTIRWGTGGVAPTLARSAGGGLVVGNLGNVGDTNDVFQVDTSAGGVASFRVQDSGNITISKHLGIGTTDIEAWTSTYRVLEWAGAAIMAPVSALGGYLGLTKNAYFDTAWKYKSTAPASRLLVQAGEFSFDVAPSGTIDTEITWTTALSIENTGAASFSQRVSTENGYDYYAGAAQKWAVLPYTTLGGADPDLTLFAQLGLGIKLAVNGDSTPAVSIDQYGVAAFNSTNQSVWGSGYQAVEFGPRAAFMYETAATAGPDSYLLVNAYFDTNWRYKTSETAVRYTMAAGAHSFQIAPSGIAGDLITWTTVLTITEAGVVRVGAGSGQSLTSGTIDVGYDVALNSGNGIVVGNNRIMTFESTVITANTRFVTSINSAGSTASVVRNDNSAGYGLLVRGGSGSNYALLVEDYLGAGLMRVDGSGNAGFNRSSLHTWSTAWRAIEYGSFASRMYHPTSNNATYTLSNAHFDGAWKYIGAGAATTIQQGQSEIAITTAPTGATGGVIAWTTQLHISEDGVAIRKESVTAGYRLDVNGKIYATAFDVNSRREWKENIESFNGSAVDLLRGIEVVSFNYRADESNEFKIGFIADDTHEWLSGREHNKMDLYNTVGVLIKANQELAQENASLRAKVDSIIAHLGI